MGEILGDVAGVSVIMDGLGEFLDGGAGLGVIINGGGAIGAVMADELQEGGGVIEDGVGAIACELSGV